MSTADPIVVKGSRFRPGWLPRPSRMSRLLMVALMLSIGWMLFAPQESAQAACAIGVSGGTDEPMPDFPDSGIMSFFSSAPAQLPADADPFQTGSGTTIMEQYGFAGVSWNTFDLGCGGVLANPPAVALNFAANLFMDVAKIMVAASNALMQAAYNPTVLTLIDPLVTSVTNSLGQQIMLLWMPLAFVALAISVAWKSRHGALSEVAKTVGGAFVILFIAAFLFANPLKAPHIADTVVTSADATLVGTINGKGGSNAASDAATEMTANLHHSLLYQSWLGGELGRSSGPTAEKYGPDLFKAQSMTWREAQTYNADPAGKGNDIIEAKHQLWDDTTQHIKDEDPRAYANLTGSNGVDRLGYGMLACIAAWCTVPFLLVSCFLIVVALAIVRVAVMAFPVLGVVAIAPPLRHLVFGLRDVVMAAIMNCIVFTLGTALLVRVIGVILSPASQSSQTTMFMQLVLLGGISFTMWKFLKPFRKLTRMVGKRNHFQEFAAAPSEETQRFGRRALRTGAGMLKTGVSSYVGSKKGVKDGIKDVINAQREEDEVRVESQPESVSPHYRYYTEEPVRPSLPQAPVEPDDVRNPNREANERGIPAQAEAPAEETYRGPSEAAATEQDPDGSTVYKIYSPSDSATFDPRAGAGTGGEQ